MRRKILLAKISTYESVGRDRKAKKNKARRIKLNIDVGREILAEMKLFVNETG